MPLVEITDKRGKKYKIQFDSTPTDADIDGVVASLNRSSDAFSGAKASAKTTARGVGATSQDPFSKALRSQQPKPKAKPKADPNPLATAIKRQLAQGAKSRKALEEERYARDVAMRGGQLDSQGRAYFGPQVEDGTDVVSPDMLFGPRRARESGFKKIATGVQGVYTGLGGMVDQVQGGGLAAAAKAAGLTPEQAAGNKAFLGQALTALLTAGEGALPNALDNGLQMLGGTSAALDPNAGEGEYLNAAMMFGLPVGAKAGGRAIAKAVPTMKKIARIAKARETGWEGYGSDLVGPHPIVPGKFDPAQPVANEALGAMFRQPKPRPQMPPQEPPPGIFAQPKPMPTVRPNGSIFEELFGTPEPATPTGLPANPRPQNARALPGQGQKDAPRMAKDRAAKAGSPKSNGPTMPEAIAEMTATINGKVGPNGSYAKALYESIPENERTMADLADAANVVEAERAGAHAAVGAVLNRLQERGRLRTGNAPKAPKATPTPEPRAETPATNAPAVKAKEPWEMTRDEFEADSQPPTYGDWFFTPDGKYVQMRGGGGIGSGRVGALDINGKFVGYYDRSTLRIATKSLRENSAQKSASEWAKSVSERVSKLRKDNEAILLKKQINDRFDKSLKDGSISQEAYNKAKNNGTLLSDSDFAKAVKVEAEIQKAKESPLVVPDNKAHKAAVQKALADGKPVPPEALADYPDLAPKAKADAPRAKEAVKGPKYYESMTDSEVVKGLRNDPKDGGMVREAVKRAKDAGHRSPTGWVTAIQKADDAAKKSATAPAATKPPEVLADYPDLAPKGLPANPRPQTAKPVAGGTAPRVTRERGAVAKITEPPAIKPDKFGFTYKFEKEGGNVVVHIEKGGVSHGNRRIWADDAAALEYSSDMTGSGYTKTQNRLIHFLSLPENARDGYIQRLKTARQNKSKTPVWLDDDYNVQTGFNPNDSRNRYLNWEPLNEAARAAKKKLERFDPEPRWIRTPSEVQGKPIYVYARSDQGKMRALAGPFNTHQEAVAAKFSLRGRLKKDGYDTSRMDGWSFGTPKDGTPAPEVLYADVKSSGESPFTPAPKSAQAKADFDAALADVKTHKPKGNVGSGLGGFDAEYARKVGVLVQKAAVYGYRTVEELIAGAVKHFGRPLTKSEETLYRQKWAEQYGSSAAEKPKPTPASVFAKPQEQPKPITKADEPFVPVKEATGLARQFDDAERAALGLPVTSKKAHTVSELADMGQTLAERGNIQVRIQKAIEGSKGLTPKEVAAAAHYKREVFNEYNDLAAKMQKATGADAHEIAQRMREIEGEMANISEAAQNTRTQWHELGMSLQVAYQPDYSLATLVARAKEAGAGAELTPAMRSKVEAYAKRISELEAQLAGVKPKVEAEVMKAAGNMKAEQAVKSRNSALNWLRKVGIIAGEAKPTGGVKGKQAGAILIPRDQMDATARAIRQLARSYISDGSANSLDTVLANLRRDVPGIDDAQSLMMLSSEYRNTILEADVAKLEIDASMRRLRSEADRKTWDTAKKIRAGAWDILNGAQRTFQAGMDISAPFLQGRKVLTNLNASGWVRGWVPMMKALAKGEKEALKVAADIKRRPMYARARKAGLELTDGNGAFVGREETFHSHIVDKLKKVPVLKVYAHALENSEAAYNAFLNSVRMDTFEKLAAKAGDDPDYLRDVARMVNIATGRGDGKFAKMLGNEVAGAVFYAPRFAYSNIQDLGTIGGAVGSRSTLGRNTALKHAARGVAVNAAAIGLASLFGDVELDPRATDFGKVTFPDGTQLDILGKTSDPIKLAVQTFYGKTSRKGNYTEPGSFQDQMPTSWVEGKLSPGARLLLGPLREGTYYNARTGEREPVTLLKALKEQLAPLGWRDVGENALGDDATPLSRVLSPLSLAGGNVGRKMKPGEKRKAPPPFSIVPPGLQKVSTGSAK